MQAEFAIMGGTGMYDPDLLETPQEVSVDTAYGSVELAIGRFRGKSVAFLPRHGKHHNVPPHLVNYRANIAALKSLGVGQVLATSAVGSLDRRHGPGTLIVVDDFLDFTHARPATFFESGKVVHIDVSEPYCNRLRATLATAADELGVHLNRSGTYVCTEGPRFESKAEIRFFQSIGGSVVGMTGVPELVLAREAGLCYATVCIVTNFAAGISPDPLTHREVLETMQANNAKLRRLLLETIACLDGSSACRCQHAAAEDLPLGEN